MHADFQRFLEHQALRFRSPLTIRRYANVLREFDIFSEHAPPGAVNSETLIRFTAAPRKNKSPRAPAGVNLRVAVLKATFAYLHEEGLTVTNPAARLVGVKLPRRKPKFLTAEEITELVRHVARRPSQNRIRDLAMVITFWQTGLRVSEVAGLRWQQLDLGRRTLMEVALKGGHVLDVDLNDETLVVLLGLREFVGSSEERAVFARYDGAPLSTRAIEARFETWRAELGWIRPLHPHLLRHTHGTGQRALGTPLEVIAESLHHADLRTALGYASVQNVELRAALGKLGACVPREILEEFREAARRSVDRPGKNSCVEESFYERRDAA